MVLFRSVYCSHLLFPATLLELLHRLLPFRQVVLRVASVVVVRLCWFLVLWCVLSLSLQLSLSLSWSLWLSLFPQAAPRPPKESSKGPPKGPPRSSQGILGSSFSCNVLWVNVLLGALFPLFEFAKLIVSSLRECTFLRSPVRLEGSSR